MPLLAKARPLQGVLVVVFGSPDIEEPPVTMATGREAESPGAIGAPAEAGRKPRRDLGFPENLKLYTAPLLAMIVVESVT